MGKQMELDEEAQARADVWKYAFGVIDARVVKVAVELEIPDIMRERGGSMSLSEISAAVGVPADKLYRIMRLLIHNRVFKKTEPPQGKVSDDNVYYAHTPLSLLFTSDNQGPYMHLHGVPPGTSQGLSLEALRTGKRPDYRNLDGENTWDHSSVLRQVFTDCMASHARVATSAMIENSPEVFRGIGTLVDVGGRHGMALSMLIKAFPWIKGVTFDLPDVVATAPPVPGIKFVGGSMFETIPKADAIMLMWILHDWSDEACIDVLKRCKEAVPSDTGKVIIVEAIIDEDGEGDEYTGPRLSLDLMMMAVLIKGKERTYKEWVHLLKAAGFSKHNVKNIKTVVSVIEAYP